MNLLQPLRASTAEAGGSTAAVDGPVVLISMWNSSHYTAAMAAANTMAYSYSAQLDPHTLLPSRVLQARPGSSSGM